MEQILNFDFSSILHITPASHFFFPRIVVALICGTIIGLERELFNKPAGIKTLMLVCLGSTLFATVSIFLGQQSRGDETRIISQIVSGIGFLGAGVILQNKIGIVGMTSAANIWFTGAVGCIIGMGEYSLALALSFVTVFFLVVYRSIERMLNSSYENSMPHSYELSIDCDPQAENYSKVQNVIKENGGILKQASLKKVGNTSKTIEIRYACVPKRHEKLLSDLQKLPGVQSIDLDERF